MIDLRLDSELLKTRDSYIKKLSEMGIRTVRDLLLYFPRTYKDEQEFTLINEMKINEDNVIRGRIKSLFSSRTKTGKTLTRAVVEDGSGEVPVVWFNQAYIKQMFYPGSEIVLTGKLKYERGRSFLMSPKYEKPKTTLLHTGRIVPVYSESEAISSKWLREKIYPLLSFAQSFEDHLPQWILEMENLMSLSDAIYHIHFAQDEEHLNKAKERLAFDELFFLQLRSLRQKWLWKMKNSKDIEKGPSISIQEFLNRLLFELTSAQKRVIDEILKDMESGVPMLRLVQGDVGSGKTVVAAAGIYANHALGAQSALMAPTEILAKQHYKTFVQLLVPLGFNVQILTGSTSERERRDILTQVASGTCDLLVGTHALIQEDVIFSNLGLAVVDEQHRFGVKQREQLLVHGKPHLLSLSATPIPRTLALTIYGDQDLSLLDEMPPGRKEIVTRIVPENKRNDAYFWVSDQIKKGRQVFIICPLVEESEVLEVKAATEEYERLRTQIFPEHRLALIHGRMKSEEKDEVMRAFSKGEVNILVSTAVVEVGIDVPNASIMLIEGADRFGLSQLHQFRGRVGRGEHQSYCFLFTDSNAEQALQRLKYMVKFKSGFDLAEVDLALRGPGEIFGVKQSGIPDLKMAKLTDTDLLNRARACVERFLDQDLELDGYPALRRKLLLFEDIKTVGKSVV